MDSHLPLARETYQKLGMNISTVKVNTLDSFVPMFRNTGKRVSLIKSRY